jgi:hypothetical protein
MCTPARAPTAQSLRCVRVLGAIIIVRGLVHDRSIARGSFRFCHQGSGEERDSPNPILAASKRIAGAAYRLHAGTVALDLDVIDATEVTPQSLQPPHLRGVKAEHVGSVGSIGVCLVFAQQPSPLGLGVTRGYGGDEFPTVVADRVARVLRFGFRVGKERGRVRAVRRDHDP